MELTEKQYRMLSEAEVALTSRISEYIIKRGVFVDRVMPFRSFHYHKYILYLKNGQEINFRDYFMDDSSIHESMPIIIRDVIKGIDLLIPFMNGKVNFFKGDLYEPVSFDMPYSQPFDALSDVDFRETVKDNPVLVKLADDSRIKELGNIFFSCKDGAVFVSHNFGVSREALKYRDFCLERSMLDYELYYSRKRLEHAFGFTCFELKPDLTEEQMQEFIDTLVTVVNAEKRLNDAFPGKRFKPQVFYIILQTKTKLVPKVVKNMVIDKKVRIREGIRVPNIGLKEGDKVSHNTFGEGMVVEVIRQTGRIVVNFEQTGRKTLVFSLANLTKL